MSKIVDFAHKILLPSSYPCELCTLTHSNFREREKWVQFRNQSGLRIDFIYLEEFRRSHRDFDNSPPLAFLHNGDGWDLALDKADFQAMNSVDDLILRISELTSDKKNSLKKV